uniref:Uncharacterized protein n=1 Tax=Anguilla anguilla TaxID=7936 RepID=A0A0E9QU75_ANGAN
MFDLQLLQDLCKQMGEIRTLITLYHFWDSNDGDKLGQSLYHPPSCNCAERVGSRIPCLTHHN